MALYQELSVYQKGYRLTREIYQSTRAFPQDERYGLISQMRRAAASIPVNIAEGYGKEESTAELKRYLRMAKGSAAELSVWLDLSKDLGYMDEQVWKDFRKKVTEIEKMLRGLIDSIV